LLLWLLFLAAWLVAFNLLSGVDKNIKSQISAVTSFVYVAFGLFTSLTSNPFDRQVFNIPEQGKDLNPILQDLGLAFHPPLLYIGYVGFAISFAFAITALLNGEFNKKWAGFMRPWASSALAFLGLGIVLGSWWAYYELGWGGWWFWDPVENASFMPWLVGIALVHSLIVMEKKGTFAIWTLLLTIIAFSLSIFGAFLVRSGILNSVHAFASDPERGRFLLLILFTIIILSLLIYSFKAHNIKRNNNNLWDLKDVLFLLNNVILLTACFTVLLGTVYPIIIDLLNLRKVSVGPPYFEIIFVPLILVLGIFASIGVIVKWSREIAIKEVLYKVFASFFSALLCAVLFLLFYNKGFYFSSFIALSLGFFIVISAFMSMFANNNNLESKIHSIPMVVGHLGFAFLVAGAVLANVYNMENNIRMKAGVVYQLDNYTFKMTQQSEFLHSNYSSKQAVIELSKDNNRFATLYPEKRTYNSSKQTTTEASIKAGFFEDVFVTLGQEFQDHSWSVAIQKKAFVRWVWLGGILISLSLFIRLFINRIMILRRKYDSR
jgi:cytochrome c-type biogenesis protein CcmF